MDLASIQRLLVTRPEEGARRLAELPGRRLRVLSLGAGVQSSTLLLLSEHGTLEPLDAAIFADTKAEPASVYAHLDVLDEATSTPIRRVSAGDLRAQVLEAAETGARASNPPFFTAPRGMLRRKCTRDFKVRPIKRALKELVGSRTIPEDLVVEQWLGISTDEVHRAKFSTARRIVHRFPLLELRMDRAACIAWLREHGHPVPPKSACTFCPYRSPESWRRVRDDDPDAFADAVRVDEALRSGPGFCGLDEAAYVHPERRPLQDAVDSASDQGDLWSWRDECDGLCGV